MPADTPLTQVAQDRAAAHPGGVVPPPYVPPPAQGEYRGAWAAGVYYEDNDLVTHDGALYAVAEAHTSAAAFETDSDNWAAVTQPADSHFDEAGILLPEALPPISVDEDELAAILATKADAGNYAPVGGGWQLGIAANTAIGEFTLATQYIGNAANQQPGTGNLPADGTALGPLGTTVNNVSGGEFFIHPDWSASGIYRLSARIHVKGAAGLAGTRFKVVLYEVAGIQPANTDAFYLDVISRVDASECDFGVLVNKTTKRVVSADFEVDPTKYYLGAFGVSVAAMPAAVTMTAFGQLEAKI
jgi:hypothetical protein